MVDEEGEDTKLFEKRERVAKSGEE